MSNPFVMHLTSLGRYAVNDSGMNWMMWIKVFVNNDWSIVFQWSQIKSTMFDTIGENLSPKTARKIWTDDNIVEIVEIEPDFIKMLIRCNIWFDKESLICLQDFRTETRALTASEWRVDKNSLSRI